MSCLLVFFWVAVVLIVLFRRKLSPKPTFDGSERDSPFSKQRLRALLAIEMAEKKGNPILDIVELDGKMRGIR